MPKKKYIVNLTDAEREELQQLLRSGKHPTRKVTRARILLKAADGSTDEEIAAALGVGRATVERTRENFVERNLEALNERPRPGQKPKLDTKTSDEWGKRAAVVFQRGDWLFDSVEDLQKAERETRRSLGVVAPKEITKITTVQRPAADKANFAQKMERLKKENEAARKQLAFFEESIPPEMRGLDFVGERMQVEWRCWGQACKGHQMQVLDWEVAELLRKAGREKALARVKDICDLSKHALKFYLGNLAQHPTAFTIVGIWYPKKEPESSPRLF